MRCRRCLIYVLCISLVISLVAFPLSTRVAASFNSYTDSFFNTIAIDAEPDPFDYGYNVSVQGWWNDSGEGLADWCNPDNYCYVSDAYTWVQVSADNATYGYDEEYDYYAVTATALDTWSWRGMQPMNYYVQGETDYDLWYCWEGFCNEYQYFEGAYLTTTASPRWVGCGDNERTDILAEYVNYSVPVPACASFTQSRQSVYFTFSQINTGDYGSALVKDALIAPESSGYGIDVWRDYIGYGSRRITSAYRNPVRNESVNGAFKPIPSRHMYGDAADFFNQSGTEDEWWAMYNAAWKALADYVEPQDGPCRLVCTHSDWRGHGGSYQ